MRRDLVLARDRLQHVRELVDEGVAPADDVPGRPPEPHVRVLFLGDEDTAESLRVRHVELVQPLDVERGRALGPVDLERVRVDAAAGEARGFERPGDAVLELDRGDEVVVHFPPGHDCANRGRDRRDLADEVPREVDDVRAEITEGAGPCLSGIEPPGALVRIPAPRLEVARAEVDDVAELARVQELADEAHGGHEAVVEAAHVHDAGLLGFLPHPVRLLRREPQRLLAQDVLAVPRRLDAGLGVDGVRPAVVEELHPVVGTCSRQSVTASAQPHSSRAASTASRLRPEIETSSGCKGTSRSFSACSARECALPMKA